MSRALIFVSAFMAGSLLLSAGRFKKMGIDQSGRRKKQKILFVSFFVPGYEGRRTTNVQKRRRRKIMQAVEVKWDDINKLDLWTIQSMGEDGYLFEIGDGRIRNILMSTGYPF